MADTPDIGYVRLLIADNGDEPILSDDELQMLLTAASGRPRLAAAEALEVIATSEVLLSKKITTQDLSTDGPAVAAALRVRAKQLRDQEAAATDSDWGFVVFGVGTAGGPPEATEIREPRWL